MSRDEVPVLERFAARENIAFTLLSDPRSEIIGAFGMRDKRFAPGTRWHGLARHMVVVVDKAGIIRDRFTGRDSRGRPEDIDTVLKRLRRAGMPGK